MKTCSYCGRENSDDNTACRECGSELGPTSRTTELLDRADTPIAHNNKISSSLTRFLQVNCFLTGAGLLAATPLFFAQHVVMGIFALIMAAFALSIWWRFLRPAAEVATEENGLILLGKKASLITYERIDSVSEVTGMLVGTLRISYTDGLGDKQKVYFIPSISRGGLFFTAEHIQQLLLEKVTQAKAKIAPQ